MPFQIGMKKLPTQAELDAIEKKKKEVQTKAKVDKAERKANKEASKTRKRRSETEALLFGSEIFEPIAKKEKEIIITFRADATKQGLYLSKCGKFAYESVSSDFYFNLYYFLDPYTDWTEDLEIAPSDRNWLFAQLTCDELENCAIKLKRAEYADEKKKALEEVMEQEKLRQAENDRIDAEFEAEQEDAELLGKSSIQETFEIQQQVNQVIENVEKTLEEMSAVEAKMCQPVEQTKVKPAFVPLFFKKVEKK